MCGRFTLRNIRQVKSRFNLNFDFPPNFNIAPSDKTLVLSDELTVMPWGYSPAWAKSSVKIINARIETLNQKPSFRSASRCLILADGWYEWGTSNSGKFPFFFHRGGDLILFAGICTQVEEKPGFAIVTKDADENIQAIHHRMPLIVEENQIDEWIHSKQTFASKQSQGCQFYKVSKFVNSPKNNNEACVKPE